MRFLRAAAAAASLPGHSRSLLRLMGCRYYAASPEEYAKRNYADNVSEYSSVLSILNLRQRPYLLRDAYDDMILDGVQPSRDVFHSLVIGSMKGSRLQDALFYRDEMKAMGLFPDVALYNFLISTSGKCKNSDLAIQILEEMKKNEVKPIAQTYICLLNACAAAGRIDLVYTIVRDMTAAGLGLNKFCYAGLITAHRNQIPVADDTAAKIVDLVKQSKGWSSAEAGTNNAENVMVGVSEEELYNLPTAEYVHRKAGFLVKQLTVYHVAFHACADLLYVEAMETILEMLKKEDRTPDVFILIQMIRCYLNAGDIDRGLKIFEDYMNSGRVPMPELYFTLIEGAMNGYTERGMKLAYDTLVLMNERSFNLSLKLGSALLLAAAGEKTGGYLTANYIWDLMQARRITPLLPAVEAYHNGLKRFELPQDDPRPQIVEQTYNNLRRRAGLSSPRI